MDRQQIGLKLTLDGLGIPLTLDSFRARLVVQKSVYLAQVAGLQLGYPFHWYLRGPYSPSLTRDVFGISSELSQGVDDSKGSTLDANSIKRLNGLKDWFAEVAPDPSRMELLASVHFLFRLHPTQDKGALRQTLRKYGKDYSEGQIQQALEELSAHGLCPTNSSK
jgi:uncharacterized protein YwgA